MRKVLRSEEGFTLAEIVAALLILMVGVVGTFTIFISSKNTSLVAQRHEVAIAQAQRAMEALRAKPYGELALTKPPAMANRLESHPNRLGYYTNASTTDASSFTVRSGTPGVSERLVLPNPDAGGTVNPDPEPFTVGGAGISGKIYRYVTWRTETCGNDAYGRPLCPGTRQSKRLIVAVTLDSNGRAALTKPVWIGTVVVDPASEPYE